MKEVYFATVNGNWEVVSILLENGADIKALDQNAQSKLDDLLTAAFNLTGVNITHVAAAQTVRRQ